MTPSGVVPVVVKQFRNQGWRKKLDRRFRGSKATRSWGWPKSWCGSGSKPRNPSLWSSPTGSTGRRSSSPACSMTPARSVSSSAVSTTNPIPGPFPDVEPLAFLEQLGRHARGLHDAGIVYRDLSMGNVLAVGDGPRTRTCRRRLQPRPDPPAARGVAPHPRHLPPAGARARSPRGVSRRLLGRGSRRAGRSNGGSTASASMPTSTSTCSRSGCGATSCAANTATGGGHHDHLPPAPEERRQARPRGLGPPVGPAPPARRTLVQMLDSVGGQPPPRRRFCRGGEPRRPGSGLATVSSSANLHSTPVRHRRHRALPATVARRPRSPPRRGRGVGR